MCAKTRRAKKRQKVQPTGSLLTIFIVIIIIAILAAAVAYFLYGTRKTEQKIIEKTTTVTKKTIPEKQKVTAKSVLEGTWVSTNDGRMLTIHGISFTLELPSVSDHEIVKGTFRITGNKATIVYAGSKDKCAESPGTYSFKISRKSVIFTVIQDKCPGRKQIFSTTWEKF